MSRKRSLYELAEWDRLAQLGLVEEPHYSYGLPGSGIECPNDSGLLRRPCRSHLFDTIFFTEIENEKRRIVICRTCGWSGSRRVGRVKANGAGWGK